MSDEVQTRLPWKAIALGGSVVFLLLTAMTVYLALRTTSTPVRVVAWVATALNIQFILLIWHFARKRS